MKVNVKTLKGTLFEIEVKLEDTVADVKKNIETVQGPDVYPAPRQMLIHKGKVLQDDTTMEENEVSDNSFMVIMLSKVTAPVTAPPPPQPPTSTTNPPSDSPHLSPLAGAPPQAAQPPPPNANTLNLFPQGLPAGAGGNLDFLLESPQFQAVQSRVRADPQILRPMLQELERQNPQLRRLFRDHRSELIRMIYDPDEDIADGWGEPSTDPESFFLTREDINALERLDAMGFKWSVVWDAFFTCDKNEEMTANYLLDHMHEFDE